MDSEGSGSYLELPLPIEVCQQIHFEALTRSLWQTPYEPFVSGFWDAWHLRRAAARHGKSALLLHPGDIEGIFRGVTTRVFQRVQALYCDPLARSIDMVHRILVAEACSAGTVPITLEAVWAICLWLHDRREEQTHATTYKLDTSWHLELVSLPVQAQDKGGQIEPAAYVCVVDFPQGRVIAFRRVHGDAVEAASGLAVYDAIAAQREPSVQGQAGLVWKLPKGIGVTVPLHLAPLERGCAELSIGLHKIDDAETTPRPEVLEQLRARWSGATQRFPRPLPEAHLDRLIDGSLFQIQRHSPRRTAADKGRQLVRRIGYSQEPASIFAALRWFLPAAQAPLVDGQVSCDGLHYESEYLRYLPTRIVTVRRTTEFEARAWIYVDDAIFCDAFASELKRHDGTYRPHR